MGDGGALAPEGSLCPRRRPESMSVPVLVSVRDAVLREEISRRLRDDGLEVIHFKEALKGVRLARRVRPALIILDQLSIDPAGCAILRALRRAGEPLLLLLSERGGDVDAVAALEAGADHFLRLPCSAAELQAHARALLRRRRGRTGPLPRELRVGDLCLCLPRRTVTLAGRPVRLAPKEFEILTVLAEHAGRVVPRADLMRVVWPSGRRVKPSTLDVHIFSLRAKIEQDPAHPSRLLTVRAVGYRLVDGKEALQDSARGVANPSH